MRRHHGPQCRCRACQTIVYPTKNCCVNQYSESQVNHVHPTHTTIMNHHTVKNNHLFPQSTSVQNTMNSVNQYGAPFPVQTPPGQVAGAFAPQGQGMSGPGSQVMGAGMPCHGQQGWKKQGKCW